ncbi:hypothetical protein I3760_01G052700 [Carya illinoinensis]|uniref:(+)-neomenthol dehydrogenase-like n=3 Tax=Carya illinoinensis TaxID=32201 RepID=A0A8T1RL32_CARIL|nr:hypothetical protein I3760_01G052700 [Carya illinoinensis]KAG6666802.1 hypothetical protein CIPAW_01G057400 [Carya illinoinensis]
MAEATHRIAVVTGANKGIGLELCRQLALKGIMVVLTARNEKRGVEAVEKLKKFGLSDRVVFHQLDVTDTTSVASLADFIKTRFEKIDILVNNAGILGATADGDAMRAIIRPAKEGDRPVRGSVNMAQTYELAEECLRTNYNGAKLMVEALITLLNLSDSPRIVNVSSYMGKLKEIPNEWAKGVLSDAESLTEERIDMVLNEFLKDLKDGSLEAKGWPAFMPAYILSKAALIAYTRVVAKKYPSLRINCVCPGYVKTDINYNDGVLTVEEGAERVLRLTQLPNEGPSGLFFSRNEVSSVD